MDSILCKNARIFYCYKQNIKLTPEIIEIIPDKILI
jgi:predicted O-linked N-acetylglucosamine transferase (SPINDLY family)